MSGTNQRNLRRNAARGAIISVFGASLLAAGGAEAAGRCGGALIIDAPTTLRAIASECNVTVAELREANPGLDPANVRPGSQVSIPDEIEPYASDRAPRVSAADARRDREAAANADEEEIYYAPSRVGEARAAQRIRARSAGAEETPVWLAAETGGSVRSFSDDSRLSFQQLSRQRIHSAGVPVAPRQYRNAIADLDAPSAELIECVSVSGAQGDQIREVRKIISTPTKTFVEVTPRAAATGFDCRLISAAAPAVSPDDVPLTPGVPAARYGLPRPLHAAPSGAAQGYRLPDYNAVGPRAAAPVPQKIALKGLVVGEEDGCQILQTETGGVWRLAAAPSLHGKSITVWGAEGASSQCGPGPSMVVSHAVYSEPLAGR